MKHTQRRSKRAIYRDVLWTLLRNGAESEDQKQTGGGKRLKCPVQEGIIIVDGYRYRYTCWVDENTFVFNGGSGKPCFVLHTFPNSTDGILADFIRNGKCSIDPGATTKHAGAAALALAKQLGVKQLRLTDNSSKYISASSSFIVSDMEFLSMGKTWYETFLPIQPAPSDRAFIEAARIRVHQNTWDDVFTCLKMKHPDISIPVDIEDIDTTASGSAMIVFQRIKEAKTTFFVDYKRDLPICSGFDSLRGTDWIAYL